MKADLPEDKSSKITIRLTPADFKALDEKRARVGMKFQRLGEQLFKDWLNGPEPARYVGPQKKVRTEKK